MNYSAELNTRKNQALYQFRTSLVFKKKGFKYRMELKVYRDFLLTVYPCHNKGLHLLCYRFILNMKKIHDALLWYVTKSIFLKS